jgi:hypothetical protein
MSDEIDDYFRDDARNDESAVIGRTWPGPFPGIF